VRSSNFQLDTPNGRNPDGSYVAERRRNYLVDIGFDPVESHQQPLHPPLPLRDNAHLGKRSYSRALFLYSLACYLWARCRAVHINSQNRSSSKLLNDTSHGRLPLCNGFTRPNMYTSYSMKNIFSVWGRLCSDQIDFLNVTRKQCKICETSQKTTDGKSLSGFRMKTFSPLGGTSLLFSIGNAT
jgi:hypothetical protein